MAAAAGGALPVPLRVRVRLAGADDTDSRNCTGTSPLSTAREPSVRHSVSKLWPLSSITFCRPNAPVAISWRSTPRHWGSVRSAPMPKVEIFSCPNCATFSVFLPRRMSMMCPVPKLMPLAWFTR